MQIAVVGTGNVGSALLFHLVDVPSVDRILVMNLKDDWSQAAILDLASARPEGAQRCDVAPFTDLGHADVVAMTSGVQMKEGQIGEDVREANARIMNSILDSASLKPTAIVIGLATPVDDITAHIAKSLGLPRRQVFGFGGDLDRSRLLYVLRRRGISPAEVGVVGEHGARVIPIYEGEQHYGEVAAQVRKFLANITAQGGSPRNLATGLLLAQLIDSVVNDRRRLHYVSGFHPAYQLFLTWPFQVGRNGVEQPEPVRLPLRATEDLERLLETKRASVGSSSPPMRGSS